MQGIPQTLRLTYNPFEPAATGPPVSGSPLFLPAALKEKALASITSLQSGSGTKALVVVGPYGAGKSCLLHWLQSSIFPSRHIKSFYFDNPGVQFYDLANHLLRTVGRKDLAKLIWELAGPHVSTPFHRSLFHSGFEQYLQTWATSRRPANVTAPLQAAISLAGITTDEQIAHCLARVVTEVVKKPYFDYRDFVPRQAGSIVPEGEEAPYFRAILKTIETGTNAVGTAFVIDEFEEIGLQKRLNRRAAYDYLATMKRLVNLANNSGLDFWLVLSMTPDAYDTTKALDSSLIQRIAGQLVQIEPLSWQDAQHLILSRLGPARGSFPVANNEQLFPFPEGPAFLRSAYHTPRKLVQLCFHAIARADKGTSVPFSVSYLRQIEDELFLDDSETERS